MLIGTVVDHNVPGNGRLALVTQDDTRAVNVGVSYSNGEHHLDARLDALVLTAV